MALARPAALSDIVASAAVRRFVRYCGLSAFNVGLGQLLLQFFFTVLGWPGVAANLSAVAVGTVPAYLISRRWVWQKRGRHSISKEVLPFWALTGAGTFLSTISVHYAARVWGTGWAVAAASITAWFFVWVVKYLTMDRVVFRQGPGPARDGQEPVAGTRA